MDIIRVSKNMAIEGDKQSCGKINLSDAAQGFATVAIHVISQKSKKSRKAPAYFLLIIDFSTSE
jgi:hypothetical protein